jgi:hypothetical protein
MKNCRYTSVKAFVFSMCDANHFYSAYNTFPSVRNFPNDFEQENWCTLKKISIWNFDNVELHIQQYNVFSAKTAIQLHKQHRQMLLLRQTNAKICITAPHSLNSFVIIGNLLLRAGKHINPTRVLRCLLINDKWKKSVLAHDDKWKVF